MKRTLVVLAMVGLALIPHARAAWLTGDPVAGEEPAVENPLSPTVRRLTLGKPHTHKGLTVWPLYTSRVDDDKAYRSLAEALTAGTLVITEKESAAVPGVLADNRGDEPVLLLAGEIVKGGRQNRTLRDDTLLPAHSGPKELPVLCVERGRWRGAQEGFGAAPMAGQSVRSGAMAGEAQQEIWDRVAKYQRDLKVESGTSDLAAVQANPETLKQVRAYREAFADIWVREPVGLVAARGERILGADVFANAALFRKHRDRLMESYALEVVARGLMKSKFIPTLARDFLARVHGAGSDWSATPGLGRLLRVNGNGIAGQALFFEEAVLHAGLVPREVKPRPVPQPMPPIEPIPLPRPMPRIIE